MQLTQLPLCLALPMLAAAAPAVTEKTVTYYTLTGAHTQTSNGTLASLINGHALVPYYQSFWFGLPKDHYCRAPQPGYGTQFSCDADTFMPLYTISGGILELATYFVNDRIVKAESGQMTYAYASAMGGWSITSDGFLSYQADTRFYACPEQRGDAPTAYQIWHDSFEPNEQATCVQLNLKATSTDNKGDNLPYGYSGN